MAGAGENGLAIGFEITGLSWQYQYGTQTYCNGLLEALAALPEVRSGQVRIVLIDRHSFVDRSALLPETLRHYEIRNRVPVRWLRPIGGNADKAGVTGALVATYDRAVLSLRCRLSSLVPADRIWSGLDVVHVWPFDISPGPAANVVTVHDLIPVIYPEFYPAEMVSLAHKCLQFARDGADLVIADSLNTRGDLISVGQLPPEKIRMIYPGVDKIFKPVSDADRLATVLTRYGLANIQFVLGLGFFDPRKNTPRVLKAMEELRACGRLPDLYLVLVGNKELAGAFDPNHEGVIGSLAGERTVFTGQIPRQDLPALFTAAKALVYCSLYEGFGLPVLEAMACGTPVLSSRASCLPEVCGDAALLVDPTDQDAITEGVYKLVTDPELRARLSRAGLERAKLFSWEKAARQHIEVYRESCRC